MGADMVISVVALPTGTNANFEAGRKYLTDLKLTDEIVQEIGIEVDLYEYETDAGRIDGNHLKAAMLGKLTELERFIDGRTFSWITVRDLQVGITGGMSWGDHTYEGSLVDTLSAVPGLWEAIGFSTDWWEPKSQDITPEEEAYIKESLGVAPTQ